MRKRRRNYLASLQGESSRSSWILREHGGSSRLREETCLTHTAYAGPLLLYVFLLAISIVLQSCKGGALQRGLRATYFPQALCGIIASCCSTPTFDATVLSLCLSFACALGTAGSTLLLVALPSYQEKPSCFKQFQFTEVFATLGEPFVWRDRSRQAPANQHRSDDKPQTSLNQLQT